MKRSLIVVLMLAGLLGSTPFPTLGSEAQESQHQTMIRVRVALIPVNVTVTDRAGKAVIDLRKEDFTLLENDELQEIRHFALQVIEPEAPIGVGHIQLRKVPTLELAPESTRTFLILLGRGKLQRSSKAIDALIRFVRISPLPQDRVAVFAYNRATDFTTDHEHVAQVLERYKAVHEKIEASIEVQSRGLFAVYGSRALPHKLQPLIDGIFLSGGGRGPLPLPPAQVEDSARISKDFREGAVALLRRELGYESSPFDKLTTDLMTDLPFDQFVSTSLVTSQDLKNIFTAIEYLRYADGQKHVLFFSDNGLFLPRADFEKGIVALANDARVAIHTSQTSGLNQRVPIQAAEERSLSRGSRPSRRDFLEASSGSPSRIWALSTLRNLSEFTGGQSSIHGDIPAALTRLNEQTRCQYLLGYYPRSEGWDGQYRRIAVKVSRPDLTVAYRHGYYANRSPKPYDREEFLAYTQVLAAANHDSNIRDLRLTAKTSTARDSADNSLLRIDMTIDASSLHFDPAEGFHVSRIELAIFVLDSDGQLLGDSWQKVDMNLTDETWRNVLKEGVKLSANLPRYSSGRVLKVIIYDYGSQKLGTLVTRVGR